MQHSDPDSISMAALDEPLDQADLDHLGRCRQCAAEVEDLTRVVSAARGSASAPTLEVPPPAVWGAIHRELGLQESLRPDPLTVRPRDEGGGARTPGVGAVARKRMAHRDGPRLIGAKYLAAAAVGAVIGGSVLWAVQAIDPDGSSEVLAEAVLAPLDGNAGQGTARVVAPGEGARTLEVAVPEDQATGYEEVWLIAADLQRMYSLGVLDGGAGRLTIPDEVDLAQFPVVDISDEPLDGKPEHSGQSLLRGTLTAVEDAPAR